MYANIFRRVEKKYLLSKKQYDILFNKINKYIEKDQYFETTICNVYFDNENNDLIITSIEKPVFKHKVRLRSYGIPSGEDDVFLEIKSKYNGVVNKRRIKLKLSDANKYLKENKYDCSNQIMKEIDYLFKYYGLKSSYYIAYDRKSYKGRNDDNLRITIDSNLRSRKENVLIEKEDGCELYFDDEMYIMEIKTLGSMPLWLVKSLSELKIYPRSFSKYGSIYKKEMEKYLC